MADQLRTREVIDLRISQSRTERRQICPRLGSKRLKVAASSRDTSFRPGGRTYDPAPAKVSTCTGCTVFGSSLSADAVHDSYPKVFITRFLTTAAVMPMTMPAFLARWGVASSRGYLRPAQLVRDRANVEGPLQIQQESQPLNKCCYSVSDLVLKRTLHH
jgi:hypothetical protein